MATVLALKWNNPNQRRNQFTRRLWPHTKRSILSTSWTDHLATHSVFISRRWRDFAASHSHYKGLSSTVKLIAIRRKSASSGSSRH